MVLLIKFLFHKVQNMLFSLVLVCTYFKFLCLMNILKLSRYKFRKFPIYEKLAFSVCHDFFFLGIIFFEENNKNYRI